ncbi:MAG: hypothetical protein FWF08_05325 [Oscillospiraceae bacterium]|nr:hypothetical protein [Oscillospiraceae bacterium]
MDAISGFFSRIGRLILCFVFVFSSGFYSQKPNKAEPTLEPPEWPVWVHRHWVWENDGTQESAMENVRSFIEKGIPVGAVIIDRPWATECNTFIPHPELYPDLADYVNMFHDIGVRVFIWATSVINEGASNFEYAKEKGYFLNGGKTVKWWAGTGAYIDYTNPEAVEWWHWQMDNVLDMGIDGWKVDQSDVHMLKLFPAKGYGNKYVSWADYKDLFFRDFYEYTREKSGKDRVISARPVDDFVFTVGFWMPPSAAPDINFAAWVGDQYNDWGGLRHALNNMFASAKYGYVSCGSDIGGFRIRERTEKEVLLRWAQLGAFCPVMENGNNQSRAPWTYDDETLEIYRNFTVLHHELIPYIYSRAAYSYETGKAMMRPQPGEYMYLLGDDILVAPFFESGNAREVRFPAGEWIYMFDETKTYKSGKQTLEIPLDEFPVFIRKGAVIPLDYVEGDYYCLANGLFEGYTNVLAYPVNGETKFGLYEEDKNGSMLSYSKNNDALTLKSGETDRPLLFRIYGEAAPQSVGFKGGPALYEASSMAGLKAEGTGYFVDDGGIIWIAVEDAAGGIEIEVNY